MAFQDYTKRLPFEKIHPQMPVQDQPPFAFDLPEVPRLQSDAIIAKVDRYSKLFTDYWFQFQFEVPADSNQILTKNVQNNAYFSLMYWVIEWADPEAPLLFEMMVSDAGKNQQFSDVHLRSTLITGTPTDPFWLANQIVFHPNSSMQVSINELSGSQNDFFLLFGGRRYHI